MSRGMGRRKQQAHTPPPIAPAWEQLVAEAMAPRPSWCDWVPWGYELNPPAPEPTPAPVEPTGSLLGLLDDRTQLMPVIDYVLAHPFPLRAFDQAVAA